MKRVAILLAGCGNRDGSEIYESTFTVLALSKAGAEIVFVAPDRDQAEVDDYVNNGTKDEARNILQESARIARGDIKPLNAVRLNDFDALIMPGGAGVAKNFSSFFTDGIEGIVKPDIAEFLTSVRNAGKPIGSICISPVILMLLFRDSGLKVTTGLDSEWVEKAKKLGVETTLKPSTEIIVDEEMKVVSTPAFMNDASFADVAIGIEKLVNKVLELA